MAYLRVRGEGGTLFPKDRAIIAADGTHIAYTILGDSGPVVVLNAGFCCPDNFWRYLAPALAKRHRVLIWNYRGTGVSGLPREPGYRSNKITTADFAVERYATDLEAILDHEGIRECVLVGHSMGVQVCLESYRVLRRRVKAMALITGPYATPLHSFYNSRWPVKIFPVAAAAVRLIPRGAGLGLWRAIFRTGIPYAVAVQMQAISRRTKEEDMEPYFEHMLHLDPLIVLKIAEAMQGHSAEDVLREVECPTLIIVGEHDKFTPPWIGSVMQSRIPDAELVSMPKGSHGTIVEFPRKVNDAVEDFLDRRLPAPAGGRAPKRTARRKPAARRPASRPRT